MGTETLNTHHNQSQINGGIVKLNNPLMGTETWIDFRNNLLVCRLG